MERLFHVEHPVRVRSPRSTPVKYIATFQDDGVPIYCIGPARKVRALIAAEEGRLPRWLCGYGHPTNAAQRRRVSRQTRKILASQEIPF